MQSTENKGFIPFRPANLENKSVRRILRAAMSLWGSAGYHGVSMKDIAAEAGVAKSLLHYHFASKEHLLIELQSEWCRMVARAVRGRIAAGPPSLAAAIGALDQVWDAMLATRAQFPFAIEVWRQSETNVAVQRRLVAFDREIRTMIVDGVRATLGDVSLPIPIDRIAALIHVALDGFSIRLWLDDDVTGVRRTFDDFKTILLAALVPSNGGVR